MATPKRTRLVALAVAFACATLAAPARADEWTATDTGFQLTMATLQIVDWGQTRSFLDGGKYSEINPILGPDPSRAKLNLMVGGAILGHALVSYLLPQPWRRVWQVVGITMEFSCVATSTSFGISWKFPL